MNITDLQAGTDWQLIVTADDGRVGSFDVRPFLNGPVFQPLRDRREFLKFSNGGYFIEWACGADISVDTIEARWRVFSNKIQSDSASENPILQGH
jgi:hypothetical protein